MEKHIVEFSYRCPKCHTKFVLGLTEQIKDSLQKGDLICPICKEDLNKDVLTVFNAANSYKEALNQLEALTKDGSTEFFGLNV